MHSPPFCGSLTRHDRVALKRKGDASNLDICNILTCAASVTWHVARDKTRFYFCVLRAVLNNSGTIVTPSVAAAKPRGLLVIGRSFMELCLR